MLYYIQYGSKLLKLELTISRFFHTNELIFFSFHFLGISLRKSRRNIPAELRWQEARAEAKLTTSRNERVDMD
jgi:hypothetical protein